LRLEFAGIGGVGEGLAKKIAIAKNVSEYFLQSSDVVRRGSHLRY
jgi:hypothetical protein